MASQESLDENDYSSIQAILSLAEKMARKKDLKVKKRRVKKFGWTRKKRSRAVRARKAIEFHVEPQYQESACPEIIQPNTSEEEEREEIKGFKVYLFDKNFGRKIPRKKKNVFRN
ncbi:uncharacterized protein LOC107360313 [Tetranychus urticae]|uniref:uncharacterized protein LOC107360313 n=1 Tax=Tetranychus urticae TaxID=32264 RepID=UPI00077BFF04|nr:uncharacterized protein LOC107360313 [Tetranychus urticae]